MRTKDRCNSLLHGNHLRGSAVRRSVPLLFIAQYEVYSISSPQIGAISTLPWHGMAIPRSSAPCNWNLACRSPSLFRGPVGSVSSGGSGRSTVSVKSGASGTTRTSLTYCRTCVAHANNNHRASSRSTRAITVAFRAKPQNNARVLWANIALSRPVQRLLLLSRVRMKSS